MGGSTSKEGETSDQFIEEYKQHYKEVKPEDETSVKIEKLWLFPMRGIMGIEVPEVKVSKYGIKYDREWTIADKTKLSCITQSPEVKLTQLRQKIEKNEATKEKHLVISIIESHRDQAPAGLSHEIRIPIRHIEGEIVDTGKGQGVRQGEEFDEWFSKFLGREVIILRSVNTSKKGLPLDVLKWGTAEDSTRTFVSKAVFHTVNEASTRDLEKRVLDRYPDPEQRAKLQVSSMAFRPNIIIDTAVPYEEDLFQEFRIANTFARNVGFCARCKAVTSNYETNERNPELEPNPTLNTYRKHALGTLFGTYHMVEIIPDEATFKKLLPGFPVPTDRKFSAKYGIVRAGDNI